MKLDKTKAVYVIYSPVVKITKVGIASNVKTRFQSLVGASGCRLELKYHSDPILNYIYIENKVHEHFKKHRAVGEWFTISPDPVLEYISSIKEEFITDKIIDESKSKNISELAKKYKVTRQSIMKRLKKADIKSVEKKNKYFKVNITDYKRIGKNIFKDKSDHIVTIKYIKDGFYLVD